MTISEGLVFSVCTDGTEGKLFCSCWENECTCVHVKCHTNPAHVCFYYKVWGSDCIYSKNMAYIRYSHSLAIDSIWYLFSQTLFLSRILSIQTLNNTFIQLWLSKINQSCCNIHQPKQIQVWDMFVNFEASEKFAFKKKKFNFFSLTFPFHPPHGKKKKCKQFQNTALRK